MRKIKSLARKALGSLDLELIRQPSGSTRRAELSGLNFSEFLDLYIATKDLSNFFFVQVGAFDGSTNDPVHELALKWQLKGLVIEPQRTAFNKLRANYDGCPNLVFENVAISTEDGERPFYTIKSRLAFLQYVNQAASFDSEHTRKLLKKHITKEATPQIKSAFKDLDLDFADCIESHPVKTTMLRSLLRKHAISRYDFLQIDTEGFDYQVLMMADIERNAPSLINYEHEHLTPEEQQSSVTYLEKIGYRTFTHDGNTTAFLPTRPQ